APTCARARAPAPTPRRATREPGWSSGWASTPEASPAQAPRGGETIAPRRRAAPRSAPDLALARELLPWRPMSAIRDHMSDHPHTIGSDQPVVEAARRMREHRIRHLPVLEGGALVGMISERDVLLGERVSPPLTVADVMSPETFAIGPDTPVSEVVAKMAEHRLGSAVIMQGVKVIGIFTTTDALEL